MKKISQFVADGDAQEVAELAIVIPILFTLIFGVFSLSRAYNIYSTITRAAQEGARVATASLCVTCTTANVPASCSVSTSPGQLPPDQCVAQAVSDALVASHLDRGQIAEVTPSPLIDCPAPVPAHSCTTPTLPSSSKTISICRNVVVNTSTTSNTALQTCGAIVSFQYSYQFLPVPFVTFNSINIPAQAQSRVEF